MKKTAVITLWNLKGGVGKTTLAYHLAYETAKPGNKVLCMDLDPQCNLSSFFENKKGAGWDNPHTVCDLLTVSPEELIGASDYKNLDYIRGCEDAARLNGLPYLAKAVNQKIVLSGTYDYIFIDCHPSMTALEDGFLSISDLILIPINLDGFSRDNANLVIQHLTDLENHLGYELAYQMVANRVRGQVKTQRMIFEDMVLRHDYPISEICIRDAAAVASANALRKPLSLHRSRSTAAGDIKELAGYLASDRKGE